MSVVDPISSAPIVGPGGTATPFFLRQWQNLVVLLTNVSNLVSSSSNGFAPQSPGDTTKFLNGAASPAYAKVTDADLSVSNITTNNASSTAHGFSPKTPAAANQFLNGAATPAYAQVKDSDLSVSNITTNNVSSAAHGFAPAAPADATKFLNGASAPAYTAVTDADLSLSNIAANNVSSSAHGFAPASPGSATQFLNGAATPAYAQVKDSDLAVSNVTNNNLSTSAHGFAPVAPNNAREFLNGAAAWSVPTGDQLPGTITNDNATAGNVGEFVSASLASGSALNLSNATITPITSISLTAGDWDVNGIVVYDGTNTTVIADTITGINSANNAFMTRPTPATVDGPAFPAGALQNNYGQAVGPARFSLAATTTIYLLARGDFSASTLTAYGMIQARRRR